MHKQESALEDETHKIPFDYEIQMNNLILVRRQDLVLINKEKRTCHLAMSENKRKQKKDTGILPGN